MFVGENTTDYLKQFGHLTFEERGFGLVDSLILCQLSYLKLEGIVGGITGQEKWVPLKSFRRHPNFEKLFSDTRYKEQNKALYTAVYNSLRFRELTINYYVDMIDETMEMQFSAVTFLLKDAAYLAFRGTDETIIGWKEDFNMAFMSPVPSQVAALRYLNLVAEQHPGTLRLGGHSKGGNTAIYTAMEAEVGIRKRILQVDCFDGPGFRDDIYQENKYLEVAKRINKLVPEASFIGMLLQNNGKYKVVKSMTSGALQHDPFSWIVKDGDFQYEKKMYRSSIYKNKALNQWISALEPEELHNFVDTLFRIINGAEAATLIELTEEGYKGAIAMLASFTHMDKETKKFMSQVIRLLFRSVLNHKGKEEKV